MGSSQPPFCDTVPLIEECEKTCRVWRRGSWEKGGNENCKQHKKKEQRKG
jgi:hypothetical protein